MASSGDSVEASVPRLGLIVVLREDESPSVLLSSLPRPEARLQVEVVFVAAPGADLAPAHAWCAAHPRSCVVEAADAATSELRRAGLAAATAEWVAFPRVDDRYGSDALPAVSSFAAAASAELPVIGLNVVRANESGELRDTHPSRYRFTGGTRTVDLRDEPSALQTHLPSAFLRRSAVVDQIDWMPVPVSASDDALLLARTSSASDAPLVGLLAEAQFIERVRPLADEEFVRFRAAAHSYLHRIAAVRALVDTDPLPEWLGWAAVHELTGILRHERATPRKATALDDDQKAEVVADAVAVMRAVGPGVAAEYAASFVSDELRAVLAGWAGVSGPQEPRWTRVDGRTGHALVRYFFEGETPDEHFRDRRGRALAIVAAKTRTVDFFAQTLVRERLVWVESEPSVATLQGQEHTRPPAPPRPRGPIASAPGVRARLRAARRSWLSRASAVRVISRVPMATRRYQQAWVFMDRANLAGDNAEHLYRWVRRHRPEINAWFVLRQDSPDWRRLAAEGFRLVAYGTVEHQLLLHAAVEYLSSHAGVDVFRPRGDRLIARDPRWRFTFLQHGVIHNDLSIWLNNQRLDLFVTSTNDEYAAIAGDDSPYAFTSQEVVLTGMPRHDELRRLSIERPWDERSGILIAPTWRNSLFLPAARPGEPRMPHPDFATSEYVTAIAALLGDERLRAAAESMGGEIVFLPHPNIGAHFPAELIPRHVRMTSYARENVQQLLTSSRVFVTDYSSVAFDAAYADTAVVYFQFDAGSIFGSNHTLHEGYFDFERDGFGVVATTLDSAVDALVSAFSDREATELYRARAKRTYAFWDDGACERIVRALSRG